MIHDLRYPHARPKGYQLDYAPRWGTRPLLDAVLAILTEYAAYLPLTVRQIFYRLVGVHDYPKDDLGYKRLADHLVTWRRARLVPFDAIRDDGVVGGSPPHYRDEAQLWGVLRHIVQNVTLDMLEPQARYVEVLCEAAGMLPQIERVAHPLSVPAYSSGGFDSLTAKRAIVDRLIDLEKPAVILHLGDCDQDGRCIFDAMAADVDAFLAVDAPELAVEWRRVALTPEQVIHYGLPTAPAKPHKRGDWTGETCQLEALPPDTLAALLEAVLEDVLDMDLVDQRHTETLALRDRALKRLNGRKP